MLDTLQKLCFMLIMEEERFEELTDELGKVSIQIFSNKQSIVWLHNSDGSKKDILYEFETLEELIKGFHSSEDQISKN